MTEKELLDDILTSFRLTKQNLKDLADYEIDLIYEAFPRYKKEYLKNLLLKAKENGYNSISDKKQTPKPIYLKPVKRLHNIFI